MRSQKKKSIWVGFPTLSLLLFQCSDVGELESLLSKQAPLEAYIEWLDSVVDRCVIKVKCFVVVRSILLDVKEKKGKCFQHATRVELQRKKK